MKVNKCFKCGTVLIFPLDSKNGDEVKCENCGDFNCVRVDEVFEGQSGDVVTLTPEQADYFSEIAEAFDAKYSEEYELGKALKSLKEKGCKFYFCQGCNNEINDEIKKIADFQLCAHCGPDAKLQEEKLRNEGSEQAKLAYSIEKLYKQARGEN